MTDRTMMGSHKPTFQERSHQMSKLQIIFLDREMPIASGFQSVVANPVIGPNATSTYNSILHEGCETVTWFFGFRLLSFNSLIPGFNYFCLLAHTAHEFSSFNERVSMAVIKAGQCVQAHENMVRIFKRFLELLCPPFLLFLPNLFYLITCDYATKAIIEIFQCGFMKKGVSGINTIGDHDGVISIMMSLYART